MNIFYFKIYFFLFLFWACPKIQAADFWISESQISEDESHSLEQRFQEFVTKNKITSGSNITLVFPDSSQPGGLIHKNFERLRAEAARLGLSGLVVEIEGRGKKAAENSLDTEHLIAKTHAENRVIREPKSVRIRRARFVINGLTTNILYFSQHGAGLVSAVAAGLTAATMTFILQKYDTKLNSLYTFYPKLILGKTLPQEAPFLLRIGAQGPRYLTHMSILVLYHLFCVKASQLGYYGAGQLLEIASELNLNLDAAFWQGKEFGASTSRLATTALQLALSFGVWQQIRADIQDDDLKELRKLVLADRDYVHRAMEAVFRASSLFGFFRGIASTMLEVLSLGIGSTITEDYSVTFMGILGVGTLGWTYQLLRFQARQAERRDQLKENPLGVSPASEDSPQPPSESNTQSEPSQRSTLRSRVFEYCSRVFRPQ